MKASRGGRLADVDTRHWPQGDARLYLFDSFQHPQRWSEITFRSGGLIGERNTFMRKLRCFLIYSLFVLFFSIVVCLSGKKRRESKSRWFIARYVGTDVTNQYWWVVHRFVMSITVQIYGGASFFDVRRCGCCAWCRWPSSRPRLKWWADPPSECIRVTPLSGMIIVFPIFFF